MIKLRKSAERGHADRGWLDSYFSFSFADYYDPRNMGFGPLRVINEDEIAPGGGFPPHGHRDMEIITYVTKGALQHKDSMGNGAVLGPGEVQRISAASGIQHSEFNASDKEGAHLLQIWITPSCPGGTPGYEQKLYPEEVRRDRLCQVVSPDGRDGSIPIRQDASLYVSTLSDGKSVSHDFGPGRSGWVQLVRGSLTVNGQALEAGDAAALTEEPLVTIVATGEAELLLFDLP